MHHRAASDVPRRAGRRAMVPAVRVAVFDTHRHDRASLEEANAADVHTLVFFEPRLTRQTVALAEGFDAVCSFVNDRIDRETLTALHAAGVRVIALRSAGFNHVDLEAAAALGIAVLRVPEHSPHAVAEHAVALVLALNRKIHRAHARVREGNFSLDGLLGFDLCGKTVGLVGLGRIGRVAATIFAGFGCEVLAHDLGMQVANVASVTLDALYARSDIISLHVPLTPASKSCAARVPRETISPIAASGRARLLLHPRGCGHAGGCRETAALRANREVARTLVGPHRVAAIPGATHAFAEPGALHEVAAAASLWFRTYARRSQAQTMHPVTA